MLKGSNYLFIGDKVNIPDLKVWLYRGEFQSSETFSAMIYKWMVVLKVFYFFYAFFQCVKGFCYLYITLCKGEIIILKF